MNPKLVKFHLPTTDQFSVAVDSSTEGADLSVERLATMPRRCEQLHIECKLKGSTFDAIGLAVAALVRIVCQSSAFGTNAYPSLPHQQGLTWRGRLLAIEDACGADVGD
jgi:hypothetical protein